MSRIFGLKLKKKKNELTLSRESEETVGFTFCQDVYVLYYIAVIFTEVNMLTS